MTEPYLPKGKDTLSRGDAVKLGARSRAATLHDVPHQEAMKLYKRGLYDINIAAIIGVSKGDVYRWRIKNGLTSNMIRQQERFSQSRKTKKPPEK